MGSAMSAKKQREEVSAPGLGSIDPQLAERVAEALIGQLSPMWDRHDLLLTAANLARVGNANTTAMANKAFAHLSPHLGKDPGVTEKSTTDQLKKALQKWGLPTSGKKKQELWERIRAQIQDSRSSLQGRPSRHGGVCDATRWDLAGWRYKRISQGKAKELFELTKHDLNDLPFRWEGTAGFAGKMFLLRDVKAQAVRRHGTWEELRAKQKSWARCMMPITS